MADKEKIIDFKKPYVWLATWFGCGLISRAPGTWGSLGALPPGIILLLWGGTPALLAGIILVTAIGFWAAKEFDAARGSHDSKMIVIDEVAGQWIALIPALSAGVLNPVLVVLAFILFRFFDILKPWPVSWFDKKLKGPAGVMGDDIVAGLYALICLWGILYAGFG